MIYEVTLGDYRFRFNNFIDAATLATTIAEKAEKLTYPKDDSEKGYHEEWKRVSGISIKLINDPTDK